MPRTNEGLATSLLLAVSLLAATPAHAQDANDDDAGSGGRAGGPIIGDPGAGYGTAWNLSGIFGIGGYGVFGIGFGALLGIPILREGFIPSLNDSFHIEAGTIFNIGFYEFVDDAVYFSPVGGARWDFHIFESFTAYGALRVGPAFGFGLADTTLYLEGGVGGFWRFIKPLALRFEVGGGVVGGGLNVGLTWFIH